CSAEAEISERHSVSRCLMRKSLVGGSSSWCSTASSAGSWTLRGCSSISVTSRSRIWYLIKPRLRTANPTALESGLGSASAARKSSLPGNTHLPSEVTNTVNCSTRRLRAGTKTWGNSRRDGRFLLECGKEQLKRGLHATDARQLCGTTVTAQPATGI